MKRDKMKKIVLVASLLFVIFSIIIIGKEIVFGNNNEIVVERKNLFQTITSDTFGEWIVSASWNENGSTQDAIIEEDTIYIEPSSDALENNEIVYHLNANMNANTSTMDFDPESIFYLVPFHVFNVTSDNKYYIDNTIDFENNRLNLRLTADDSLIGYIDFGSMPHYGEATSSDKVKWDFDTSTIYVMNNQLISASESFDMSVDIAYSIVPSLVGGEKFGVDSVFSLLWSEEYNFNTLYTQVEYVDLNTYANLSNVKKENVVVHDEWNNAWGESATEYDFYLEYKLSGDVEANEEYTLQVTPTVTGGEIVSFGDGNTFELGNYSNFINSSYYELTNDANLTFNRTFIVGYNFEGAEKLNTSFNVGVDLTSSSVMNEILTWNYENVNPDLFVPEYPSGTNTNVKYSMTSDNAGVGAINRLKLGNNVLFDYLVESDTSTINKTSNGNVKAFNLWNDTENGTKSYSINLGYDSTSLVYDYDESVLNEGDYRLVSFYPQDDLEYDYVVSDNEYILEKNSNYSTYTEKEVYVKINSGEWQKIGSYKKDENGNIVYNAVDSKTISNDNVSESNPIELPSNTTNLKVVYTGVRAAIYMGYNFKLELISSDNVRNELDENNDSAIWLKTKVDRFYNESKIVYIDNSLSELTVKTNMNTSLVPTTREVVDGERADIVTFKANVYEQLNFNNLSVDEIGNYLTEQRKATMYVLLPAGAILDGDAIVEMYNVNGNVTTNVTATDNYDGSGRTLLKILVNKPTDINNYYISETFAQTGFTLALKLIYTSSANLNNGNILYSDFVYFSNTELSEAYSSISSIDSSNFSSDAIQNSLNKIGDVSYAAYLAKTNFAELEKVTVVASDYSLKVSLDSNINYKDTISINEGKDYRYRMQYTYGDTSDQITNLVFFNPVGVLLNDASFNGILKSIDTSYLENIMGIKPTIYYSTVSNIDLSDSMYTDLTNTAYWSTNVSDLSKVTVIAVDCGDYTFKGTDTASPMLDIIMTAPNAFNSNKTNVSYNESLIKYNNNLGGQTKKTGIVTINLVQASITISTYVKDGVGGTDYGSSTIDNPVLLNGEYGYLIKVENNNNVSYNNVEITNELPELAKFSESNIKYFLNESTTLENVGDDKLVKVAAVGNKITFVITELGSDVVNIWIPVTIDSELVNENNYLLTNKVNLTGVNNVIYAGSPIYSYNKVDMPILSFKKYFKSSDDAVYKDTGMKILIGKNKTYNYMIEIKNLSSVIANDITIIDKVPNGLNVDTASISNDGIYDSVNKTITWNLDNINTTTNLTYNVSLDESALLGTIYNSNASVKVVNPYDKSKYLYDLDTNEINLWYQVVSDLNISNTILGDLSNKDLMFNYILTLSTDAINAGTYEVVDKDDKFVDNIVISNEGTAEFSFSLKDSSSVVIKYLPANVNYEIKAIMADGYEMSSTSLSTQVANYLLVNGKTTEEPIINIDFTNKYDVSTNISLGALVKYDQEMLGNEFSFELTNGTDTQIKNNDENGNILFDNLNFNNIEGNFTYTVSQLKGTNTKVNYDMTKFTISIILENDGKGNLNSNIKYYDKDMNEVSKIEFNNVYIPNGLIIGNINTSDYINKEIEFEYVLQLTNGVAGSYKVKNNLGEDLDDLVILDDGTVNLEFKLKSNEYIRIIELTPGVIYNVQQKLVPYYTSSMSGVTYTTDQENSLISTSGEVSDGTIQLLIENNYKTSGKYIPFVAVSLENKPLDDAEFSFLLKDISDGYTNGYGDIAVNVINGNVDFKEIEYNRPGTYKYEIVQIKGNSNHIHYDLTKCYLTVVLTDDGKGVLGVNASYEYENENNGFVNKYSELPIIIKPDVPEMERPDIDNPNTMDRGIVIGILGVITFILILIERRVRKKVTKYNLGS